jgi:hypothetical protein
MARKIWVASYSANPIAPPPRELGEAQATLAVRIWADLLR